jgi:hypothetical protein
MPKGIYHRTCRARPIAEYNIFLSIVLSFSRNNKFVKLDEQTIIVPPNLFYTVKNKRVGF